MTPAGKVCISSMPVFSIDQTGLVMVGADGQGWQDLAAPLDAQSAAWRPASDEVLFRGNNRLQITGRDRTPFDVVTTTGFNSPAWSPDGSQFVAQQKIHDHTDLALFDASGRLIKYLTKPPSATRRSPNNVCARLVARRQDDPVPVRPRRWAGRVDALPHERGRFGDCAVSAESAEEHADQV